MILFSEQSRCCYLMTRESSLQRHCFLFFWCFGEGGCWGNLQKHLIFCCLVGHVCGFFYYLGSRTSCHCCSHSCINNFYLICKFITFLGPCFDSVLIISMCFLLKAVRRGLLDNVDIHLYIFIALFNNILYKRYGLV